MKKNLIRIGIIAVLGLIIYAWSTTRNIQVLQELEASAISKVEIWNNDKPATLTEQEDIQRFLDILQSTRIHKRSMPDRAGSTAVFIYYKNGEESEMAINAEHINFDDGKYKCDKSICDEIQELYEEFLTE